MENLTSQLSQGYDARDTPVKSIYSGAEINVKNHSMASYAGASSKEPNNNNKEGKDYLIYSLNIENKSLRQENKEQKLPSFKLKKDIEYS